MGDEGLVWREYRRQQKIIKSKRNAIERDSDAFSAGVTTKFAEENGCEVKQINDNHYQIISEELSWLLNYYPSNARLYCDKNHDTPFIPVGERPFLPDVVIAFVKKVNETLNKGDK